MKKPAILSIFGVILLCVGVLESFSTIENALFEPLLDKLKKYKKDIPTEQVYIHTDKTLYKQGESLWFSVYLLDGNKNRLSTISDIVYVEVINPKGTLLKKYTIITNKGKAHGDFSFASNTEGGIYKIKAYTKWNKQFDEKCIFTKDIQVQATIKPRLLMSLDFIRKAYGPGDNVQATFKATTLENKPLANAEISYNAYIKGEKLLLNLATTNEKGEVFISLQLPDNLKTEDGLLNILINHEGFTESISRQIPLTLGENIYLAFFPESGNLIENAETNLAFKANNTHNKPIDVEGFIVDDKGEKCVSFKSFHDGMGACTFTPKSGRTYFAKITKPSKITKEFPLPSAQKEGFLFTVEKEKENIDLKIYSTANADAYIIAHAKENNYIHQDLDLKKGWNTMAIPTLHLPAGIVYITLFDKNGNAQCERLVFVNNHKKLNIDISTDKEKYLPREKVLLTVKTTNENNQAVPANISLAVVNDKNISLANDKQDNILSYFLLSSEVTGKIHEPSFYFNQKEPKATKAIDYLLLTQGWRRFTWQAVKTYNHNNTNLTKAEKTEIQGSILGDTQKNIIIKIQETGETTETNKYGHFVFPKVDLTNPKHLTIKHPNGNKRTIIIDQYKEYSFAPYIKGQIILQDKDFDIQNVIIGVHGSDKTTNPDEQGHFELKTFPENAMTFFVKVNNNETTYLIDDYFDRKIHISPYMLYKNVIAEAQPMDDIAEDKEFKFRALKNDLIINPENAAEIKDVAIAINVDSTIVAPIEKTKKLYAPKPTQTIYYRARVFPLPNYTTDQNTAVRTDFRETIYWNATLSTDSKGSAAVTFYNSDEITSFRAIAEGISENGLIGQQEYNYHTQKAISIDSKLPEFLCFEDNAIFSVLLKNNTGNQVNGLLKIHLPESLHATKKEFEATINPNSFETIDIPVTVLNKKGNFNITFQFESKKGNDAFTHSFHIFPKGFPATISFSGTESQNKYTFNISDPIEGSVKAKVIAYPNIIADLMSGMESIFEEPYGCFEQISSSNYPNILALRFMNQNNIAEPAIAQKAYNYIDKGYNKLIAYETKDKGYEWFGSVPPHEGLTAYGLLEFNDMKEVYPNVDDQMVARTQKWLLSRRNGKGDFIVDSKALDDFGRANIYVNNAYILYSLSETGLTDFNKEYEKAYAEAIASKDAYRLALMANTAANLRKSANQKQLIDEIDQILKKDTIGNLTLEHTITVSYGKSAQIETASLLLMAFIKNNSHSNHQLKLTDYIIKSRDSYSGFGSTQATVMALKALTRLSDKETSETKQGTISVECNNTNTGTIAYTSKSAEKPVINGIEKHLTKGSNNISVTFDNKKATIPHTLSVTYNTYTPANSENCKITLNTALTANSCKTGETVRATTKIHNTLNETLPMVVAKMGIPSGLAPQPWQLKKLQEEGAFSYYEILNNYIVFYFSHIKAKETKNINLDLKAEIKGTYTAPSSCAYLYYTNEDKVWNQGLATKIE